MNRLLLFIILGFISGGVSAQSDFKILNNILRSHDIDGQMLLFDLNENEYYSNTYLDRKRLPGTSFQIFNALVFYQIGMVKDSSAKLMWDGRMNYFNDYEVPSWNTDLTLSQAFKTGANWYFKELSEHVEHKIFRKYIKKAKYGRVRSSGKMNPDFWNGGRGRITASLKDQIKFLRKMHRYKLPFDTITIDKVKELMYVEQKTGYKLYEKYGLSDTSTCIFCKKSDYGWYLGFLETDDNTYFFISLIDKPIDEEREDFFELRKAVIVDSMEQLFDVKIE